MLLLVNFAISRNSIFFLQSFSCSPRHRNCTHRSHNINYSAPEMVYSQTFRSPSEFFSADTDPIDPYTFLTCLKSNIAHLLPTSSRHRISIQCFQTPHNLLECSNVFVSLNCNHSPFNSPYIGTYCILASSDKFFLHELNTRVDSVSINHHNSAFPNDTQEKTHALLLRLLLL